VIQEGGTALPNGVGQGADAPDELELGGVMGQCCRTCSGELALSMPSRSLIPARVWWIGGNRWKRGEKETQREGESDREGRGA
jgi:hypothetical protein